MKEHFFQCPYCWETISMLLDTSVSQQSYIEDCEVCCRPMNITYQTQAREITNFEVQAIQ
ncbi:CPXCG motif-containing cysteine-rich protein [Flavobacteriaceae bacterium 14752]|uniref:CPXCG motif-containing cysteine-rich protein n=1 Tax=Mesohalobacter salilacus TaxID=2491711 RepID=UPI000F63CAF9|nr:CPXCG motif-containing cysteine-rich protein [Flavobacteriaceae bacterium 14752]